MTGCDRLLRLAARIVPCDLRGDWYREWAAEVHYSADRAARRGESRAMTRTRLLTRCLGAVIHAAWLRWDRWRMEMLLQDLKYALRTLTRKPGFAVVTVLTLALGIGANAAIFSAVQAVLLRPLPFPEPSQLVSVFRTSIKMPDRIGGSVSPPDYVDWRRDNRSFVDLAAISAGSFSLTGAGGAEQISGANVTGGFFKVLAVPALHGRTLADADDAVNGPNVAVISHALWTRRFGADPTAVGRIVTLQQTPYEIVGVMPRSFSYPLQSEVWLPLRFPATVLETQRGAQYLDVIARLRPQVTLEQARADMRTIAARLAQQYPNNNAASSSSVHPMRDSLVGDVWQPLVMLLAAVGFVLLIVCVNVTNLVLTRALGRTRELAVRAALGAGRARLVRSVLVEGLVLALIGGAAGLAVAVWATQGIAALQTALGIPLLDQTRIDSTVLLFTLAVSLVAALLVSALPAWHASSAGSVGQQIREESTTSTGDRGRQGIRAALIVAETALAVVLLVGAGLLLRSFMQLTSVDPGFDTARVQTFNISLPAARYPQPAQRAEFIERLRAEIAKQPGVEAVGTIFGLPLTNFRYVISMSTLDGRKLDNDEQMRRSPQVRVVSPDYFRALSIPIVRGRAIADNDRLGAPYVVLVNETAAAQLWPGADPLGHEFALGTRLGQGGASAGGIVVGVAGDVRDHGPAARVAPTVYLSHAQFPMAFNSVVVKSRSDAAGPVEPLRAVVAALDADLPMFSVRTMQQITDNAVAQPRAYVLLLGLFAAVAVILAALGIYGVLTHAVAQRTREIGIRLALGAGRREVVAMVVRRAAVLSAAGLAIGLTAASAATKLIQGLLFGIEPTDGMTFIAVSLGLLAVALVAAWLPARRAARIDPVRALRYE